VADVRNGDDQAPALGLALAEHGRLAVDGIVEIARVLAVDGDERHVGEIDAALAVGGAHGRGQRRRLGQRLLGEDVRHFVLANRDLDLHAGVVDLAEDFGDAPERLRMQ
jgi:hypothetical protein